MSHPAFCVDGTLAPTFNCRDSAQLPCKLWPAAGTVLTCRGSLSRHEREVLEETVFMFGRAPESYDVMHPSGSLLKTPCGQGFLNVYPDGRHWHLPGGMLAADELKPSMVGWLRQIAEMQRRTIAVYSITADEVPLFRDAGYAVNKFGEEPVIDLGGLNWQGKPFEWIRRQTNFCRRQGMVVDEITCPEACKSLSQELQAVLVEDLSDRVYSRPLQLLEGHFDPQFLFRGRLFVARCGEAGRTEAFVAVYPMENGQSWAFETYRRRKDAPRGTVPFLFRTVIDQLQAEGVRRVSLCLVLGRGVTNDISAEADPRIRWLLGSGYSRLNFIFNTAGQDHFKSRFRPRYVDRYLCVTPHNSLSSIASFLKTSGALRPNLRNLAARLLKRFGRSSNPG